MKPVGICVFCLFQLKRTGISDLVTFGIDHAEIDKDLPVLLLQEVKFLGQKRIVAQTVQTKALGQKAHIGQPFV